MAYRYGLLGEKLGHSISPEIHRLIFNHLGIEGQYALFQTDARDIYSFLNNARKENIRGFNITIPYKGVALKYMDEISDIAQETQSINTVSVSDLGLVGDNTDYYGLKKLLEHEGIDVRNKSVLILGTGGAARTSACLLYDLGAESICMASRDKNKTIDVFTGVSVIGYDEIKTAGAFDILINATPVGMYPDVIKSPVADKDLDNISCVVDLIYNPKETMLLSQAGARGIKHANGLYMLVAQAVRAQEIWQNRKISDGLIDEIYEKL